MIKRIARDIPLFESLGLFTEAPKKKRKPRVISVRPIRKDYADLVDPEESFDIDDIDDTSDDLSDYDDLGIDDLDAFGDDISDDEFADDLPDDDLDDSDIDMDDPELSGDIGIDDIPLDDEEGTPEDVPEEQPPVEGDTAEPTQEPETTPADAGSEEPAPTPEEGTDSPVEGGEVPPEGDAGGGEVIDATAGQEDPETSGDIGGGADLDLVPDDGTDPNQMDPGAPNDEQTTGEENITKDDVRKYELFKRFINLLKSIEYFIEKLENGVSDNENFEIVIKKAHKKFKSLESLTKDYMLLKFQTDSFLQNSFFYEKIKASTLLIFNFLELNKNKEDNK